MRYIPDKMTYKEYKESNTVRHIADTVGFMYLFMLLLQFVWELPVLKIAMAAGISLEKIRDYLENPAILLVFNVLLTSIIFTVPFIALCGRERQKPSGIIHYGAPKRETFLPLVLLGSSLCLVANSIASVITQILEQIGLEGKNTFDNLPQGVWGIVLAVFAVSLAPAFLEEFAFRGVVFGLVRRMGEGFAIFVSAIAFSVMHLNISQIPFAFFAGIIIGFVYVKSESIWAAVTVHAINNLMSLVLSYSLEGVSAKLGNFISLMVITLSCVVALASFYAYLRRGGNFKLHSSQTSLCTKKKAVGFLKSPTIIVSVVVTIILSIAN